MFEILKKTLFSIFEQQNVNCENPKNIPEYEENVSRNQTINMNR